MKKTLSLFVLCLSITAVSAQSYVFKARTGFNEYKQLQITLKNGNAYISPSNIAADVTLTSAAFDLAGVGIQDGSFIIPDDGNSYWLIDFENPEASGPAPKGQNCVSCDCQDRNQYGGGGICDRTMSYDRRKMGCTSTCSFCLMKRVPCGSKAGGSTETSGAFVIVKADKIIFQ